MHARERKIATVGDNSGAKNGGSEGCRIRSFLVYEYIVAIPGHLVCEYIVAMTI